MTIEEPMRLPAQLRDAMLCWSPAISHQRSVPREGSGYARVMDAEEVIAVVRVARGVWVESTDAGKFTGFRARSAEPKDALEVLLEDLQILNGTSDFVAELDSGTVTTSIATITPSALSETDALSRRVTSHLIPAGDIPDLLVSGEISDAATVAALLAARFAPDA